MSSKKDISEYERLRLENIQRNEEFMNSLGLNELKKDLVTETAINKQATQKGVTRGSTKRHIAAVPERRSSRVTDARLQEEIKLLKDEGKLDLADEKAKQLEDIKRKKLEGSYEAVLESYYSERSEPRFLPEPISVYPAYNCPPETDKWGSVIFNDLRNLSGLKDKVKKEKKSEDLNQSYLSKLTVAQEDCAKVVEARIVSTMFHPSSQKLICFAGDKSGCLGIWDVNFGKSQGTNFDHSLANEEGVYKYLPHKANVSSIHCWENSSNRVYTTSYDGTVRVLDVNNEQFELIYELPDEDIDLMISDACFLRDGNTSLLGLSNGETCMIDTRSDKKNNLIWKKSLQDSKINSIQQSPIDENILLTAGSGKAGEIRMYDLRLLGKPKYNSLVSLNKHSRSINAAYFSGDGNHIVSVSQDDYIFLWYNYMESNPSIHKLRHNNQTGRWLSTFKPAFDPKDLNTFIIGSMDQPRRLEVFQVNTKTHSLDKLIDLKGEYLASVQSRNCFHPHLPVIAGGNSSGRISILQ